MPFQGRERKDKTLLQVKNDDKHLKKRSDKNDDRGSMYVNNSLKDPISGDDVYLSEQV